MVEAQILRCDVCGLEWYSFERDWCDCEGSVSVCGLPDWCIVVLEEV
jgi:hypothetical protein